MLAVTMTPFSILERTSVITLIMRMEYIVPNLRKL